MIEQLFSHASIVPDAVTPARAAELRTGLTFDRYVLLDRGSYEVAAFTNDIAIRELVARAAPHVGVVSAVGARVVRLCAGDYLLARHDDVHAAIATGVAAGRRYELVLDLSPVPCDAEIHYRRRGQVFFRVPCVPGSLAIVERTPAVTCNHTYVSKLAPDAEIVRLVIQAVA